MDRVVRDGRVAVLYSPGWGSGWFSSHYIKELIFDPSVVKWVETGERDKIQNYLTLKYPDIYLGGLENLTIRWVPAGSAFRIDEYDGNESVIIKEEDDWLIA